MRFSKLTAIATLFAALGASAQHDPSVYGDYPFLNLDSNRIYQPAGPALDMAFRQLDSLIRRGDRQLNIIQIGDSHIQAGFLSEQVRENLQQTFALDNGGRGFVFPYRIGNTNNPLNYRVSFTGEWFACRNVERRRNCRLGLAGMSATTFDLEATVTIDPNRHKETRPYAITRVKVFFDRSATSFEPMLRGARIIEISDYSQYREFILLKPERAVTLGFDRTDDRQDHFTLYGITLESEDPGIVYSSVGINGADVTAWLRCSLLDSQLAVLQPHLIILSLGANDAYPKNFSPAQFKANYRKLIERVRAAVPGASILLTTPGDAYRYRRYYNYNYVRARQAIFELAKEEQLAVWDFYSAMGGANSIYDWYRAGLATNDKIHLTEVGYALQGNLFYDALMEAYFSYLQNQGK